MLNGGSAKARSTDPSGTRASPFKQSSLRIEFRGTATTWELREHVAIRQLATLYNTLIVSRSRTDATCRAKRYTLITGHRPLTTDAHETRRYLPAPFFAAAGLRRHRTLGDADHSQHRLEVQRSAAGRRSARRAPAGLCLQPRSPSELRCLGGKMPSVAWG